MAGRQETASRTPASIKTARRLMEVIDALRQEIAALIPVLKTEETAHHWLVKAKFVLAEADVPFAMLEAFGFALHLAMFTPSLTGVTSVDRLVRQRKSRETPEERVALAALAASKFRLLRLLARQTSELIFAEDMTTGEFLTLIDEDIPASAAGTIMFVRLCALPDGLSSVAGPRTPLDKSALDIVLAFARPGKGLNNSARAAATLYKHLVRNGGPRIKGMNALPPVEEESAEDSVQREEDCEIERLAKSWASLGPGAEPCAASVFEARRLTSSLHLTRALEACVAARDRRETVLAEAWSRLAYIQMETYHRRAVAGTGAEKAPLDVIGGAIDRAIASRSFPLKARDLFNDLRQRLMASNASAARSVEGKGAAGEELARVLKLIQALRAKTVDQGCTEQEALASAAKVAELLDRYGLSLSEIEMRHQACEGVGIDTGRRRRVSLDECVTTIALFCDCKVWSEKSAGGEIRYVYFGLPADVQAAHYLYDLIDVTFEAETARFRRGAVHASAETGARRASVNSFQVGLSTGICMKLKALKTERDAANLRSSGRDLVPVKSSVIEDELEKLGLAFERKAQSRKRRVVSDAYEAGREAGRKFEMRAGLESTRDRAA